MAQPHQPAIGLGAGSSFAGRGRLIPCRVRGTEYEWGNICHRDPSGLGVHACINPDGDEHPGDCLCACGTTRVHGRPKNRPA